MADPVIVPPIPTITQTHSPDTSPGMDQLQKAFDQVLPEIKTEPSKKTPAPVTTEPVKPKEVPPEPVKPAKEPEKPAAQEPAKESQFDVPSFLEEALKSEPSQAKEPEEWPEELPDFKNSEEAKARYKKWRDTYQSQKSELKKLQQKPTLDSNQLARMEQLETQNREMQKVLERIGVEQSTEYQRTIIQPLLRSWQEAAKIVKDAGGDPDALARAMSLGGKAQFEALDELFQDMPESAKIEAHDALRTYRRYEEARRQTLANAPAAAQEIRKREADRQVQELNRQREDMKTIFEKQVARLRDDAKLELLLRTDKPEGKWWNDQGERIIEDGRSLFLENTDMDKVAMACVLAPAADAYRKLWLNSQKKVGELQKIINEKIGNEPNLSESGGSQGIPTSDQQLKDDLKQPFANVFLREFHRAQARSR